MRGFVALGLIVVAVMTGGCASQQAGKRSWWTLNEQTFAPIVPGSTKAEVERLAGKPLTTMVFANLGEEVWDYRFLGGTRPFIAEVHFDMQGRTKYYTTYLDQCALGPMGCR
jgi:hypothetical protein